MNRYHKIPGVFRRTEEKPCNLIIGEWYTPELEVLSELDIWYFTEKVDGTNIRILWDGNRVEFRGKTDNAQLYKGLVDRLEELFGGPANEGIFEQLFGETEVCLYGEGFGSKIQSGGAYFPDSQTGQNEFALFDILIDGAYLQRENVEQIGASLGCEVAPLRGSGSLLGAIDHMQWEISQGRIPTSKWGNKQIEGVIAKTDPEFKDRRGNRIITKLKYEDFIPITKIDADIWEDNGGQ